MVRRVLLPRKQPQALRIGTRCAGQDKRVYQVQWANSAKKTKVWRLAKTHKAKPKKKAVLIGGHKPELPGYTLRFVRTLQDYAEQKANQSGSHEYVVFEVLLPLLHQINKLFQFAERKASNIIIADAAVKNDLRVLLSSIEDDRIDIMKQKQDSSSEQRLQAYNQLIQSTEFNTAKIFVGKKI